MADSPDSHDQFVADRLIAEIGRLTDGQGRLLLWSALAQVDPSAAAIQTRLTAKQATTIINRLRSYLAQRCADERLRPD